MTALADEAPRETPTADDWEMQTLAPALVTYRLRDRAQESRHSSIWDTGSAAQALRFHQGTVIAAAEPAP